MQGWLSQLEAARQNLGGRHGSHITHTHTLIQYQTLNMQALLTLLPRLAERTCAFINPSRNILKPWGRWTHAASAPWSHIILFCTRTRDPKGIPLGTPELPDRTTPELPPTYWLFWGTQG